MYIFKNRNLEEKHLSLLINTSSYLKIFVLILDGVHVQSSLRTTCDQQLLQLIHLHFELDH